MLTNNYKKMALCNVLGRSDSTYNRFQQQLVAKNGTSFLSYCTYNTLGYYNILGEILRNPSTAVIARTCCFGDGNVTPTADDYNLSGNVITNLSFTTTMSYTQEDDGVRMTAVYRITNNNSTPVTISEVGLFGKGFTSLTGSGGDEILLERSLLDYPVTIEAGGFGDVTYEVKAYYPTFPTA